MCATHKWCLASHLCSQSRPRVGIMIVAETCLQSPQQGLALSLYFRIPPPCASVRALLTWGVQAPTSMGQAGQHFCCRESLPRAEGWGLRRPLASGPARLQPIEF